MMRNQCWPSKLREKSPFQIHCKILRSGALDVNVVCVLKEKQVFDCSGHISSHLFKHLEPSVQMLVNVTPP